MDIIGLDYETFYGGDYTLSKMTTEEYVRDPRFEAILLSVKINEEKPFWVPGPKIAATLASLNLSRNAIIAHHAHFDGLILSHHYGEYPKLIIDTLSMARALFGSNGRLSLAKLAERYGIGVKGTEVVMAKDKHLADFSPYELARYGEYSCNDTALAVTLARHMMPHFSRSELQIIDHVVKMFTEPTLVLDDVLLSAYAKTLAAEKATLMLQANVQRADIMSNDKFAEQLEALGIDPPRKISPTFYKKSAEEQTALLASGKALTYAFAKTDPGMQALQEHPDERVQFLVEARLKNKSTIAEKGAERLIGMAGRGPATVYLKYSGASGTHRLSGGDKFNWQSMKRGSDLRNAVMAPDGDVVIVGDSSNIEARLLDWLAGQDDMVEVYRKSDAKTGPDMYCVIAGLIYKRSITKAENPDERQFGKVTKLGLGFGMGANKFITAVRGQAKGKDGKPMIITPQFSQEVVETYRRAHEQVRKLWKRGEDALKFIAAGQYGVAVDYQGIVTTCRDGLLMPGGLKILYPELEFKQNSEQGWGGEWSFWNGKTREHIYGPKVVENIIQCLARLIVFEQCRLTAKEVQGVGRWVHSVHDEGIFRAHAFDGPYVLEVLMRNMRTPLSWCQTLPLNSEGGFHRRYGKAKS